MGLLVVDEMKPSPLHFRRGSHSCDNIRLLPSFYKDGLEITTLQFDRSKAARIRTKATVDDVQKGLNTFTIRSSSLSTSS